MKTLIFQLQAQTQELKSIYVEKTKKWAEEEFERMAEMAKWSREKWCQYLGIEPEERNGFLDFPRGFYNTRNARIFNNALTKAQNINRGGIEKFVNRAEADAIAHYEASIEKLAIRIEAKGLDQDKLELSSSRLERNFETVITDGIKKVRAFTILAYGEIQRPHYRYLIK